MTAYPEKFSEAVAEKLGNYIYRLIDPRNGETFYIGRGKGNRVRISLLDQTRYAWRVSKSRAEAADFVISVIRGVAVGAFIA